MRDLRGHRAERRRSKVEKRKRERFLWAEEGGDQLLRDGGVNNCEEKKHYSTEAEAIKARFRYRSRRLFSTIDYYFCEVHQSFELGHNKRMSQRAVGEREYSMMIETAAQHFLRKDPVVYMQRTDKEVA